MARVVSLGLILLASSLLAADPSGNRLAYLNGPLDPYYPHRNFAKLTTPQWVGEEGVECVITLGIDDMRDTAKYEAFVRPILDRLKKIDGRAPLSIMTCDVKPDDPQLQAWLKEGLSIECHTADHPCPLLQKSDFAAAKSTYDRCLNTMFKIPGNFPVAFRMPCCDSLNTPSPRFWEHIFNATTENGHFLQVDTSVFNVITGKDEELPRAIRFNEAGEERFRRYIPFPSFVNTIEDYPYPYVIGNQCWEFPCVTPTDWSAQHVQKPNNPQTVRDWKYALDAAVAKQGTFNLVFHPHGWIRPDQVVDLIDHAVDRHGKKVKFLTFRDCAQRLEKNFLQGHPIRSLVGKDNGVRVLDVNNDGLMDVIVANKKAHATFVWNAKDGKFDETFFPRYLESKQEAKPLFGIMGKEKQATYVAANGAEAWRWDKDHWAGPGATTISGSEADNLAFCDIDGDGFAELVGYGGSTHEAVIWLGVDKLVPHRVDFPKARFVQIEHLQKAPFRGVRFIDVNGDQKLDYVESNERACAVYLFDSWERGWAIKVFDHERDKPAEGMPMLAPFVRADGTNNGVWLHSGKLWWQNEDTAKLPDLVDRFDLKELKPLIEPAVAAYELKKQKEITAREFADQRQHDERIARLALMRRRSELAKQPGIQLGTAKVDITPSYNVRLAGYAARKSENEGVEQRIYARAIAFECDDGRPAVIMSVENCGVPEAMVEAALERINDGRVIGRLARERFVVTSTHTHSAPWINGFAPLLFPYDLPEEERKHVDQYTAELTRKIAEAAVNAINKRRTAWLYRGEVRGTFARNRRNIPAEGEGPVDQRVPVLVARDDSQQPVAVLFNYACHNTTLGGDWNKIGGDWSGYAAAKIEELRPNLVALSLIGCGADANPHPRGTLDLAKGHGEKLAWDVRAESLRELQPLDHKLDCKLTHIDLPWDKRPTKEDFEKLAETDKGIKGYHAKHFLKKLAAGEKIDEPLKYPIATWTFGDDLAMVFLGGEVVVDYAIALAERLDQDKLWVTSYANDVPCYIPSKRILKEGGYEAESSLLYYARPARLTTDVEDLILEAVQKLLPHQFYTAERQLEFPPAKSTKEALDSFRLPEGFKIELVASEPLIVDPVAFDWSPDGSLWVVEMRDYPLGIDGKGKPGGRVKHLVDKDGDGKYDEATTFLDDIPYPTGVKVWRKGILVSAAPEIFYAEDTNNDGKADKRETLYRGFGEGNQQHRVNGLRWGLDGWLYVGNGDSGGEIESVKTGKRVAIGGRDLRIRPDAGDLEAQSGGTQFGRECDDWGNWFGGNNSNPMWHYTLDDHYLRRNPHIAAPGVQKQVSVTPGNALVYPASKTLMRFNDFHTANRFTSACSPMVYRDRLLGDDFYGNAFVCEPVHNLVHRELMSAEGATFTSRRADSEKESEFLASTDNWFRPTMVRTGPDGALWISDMYRFVIEHPTWIPQTWQKKLDLRAGEDKGRIYRVYRTAAKPRKLENLTGFDTGELVGMLSSPNGWQRDMAQQMLLWDKHEADVPLLRKLLKESKEPTARLHALCTLEGLGKLEAADVVAATKDEHAGVRKHAFRCAEAFIAKSPEVLHAVTNSDDPDKFVRVQVAYTLGASKDSKALSALALTLANHRDDPILTAAALSSVREDSLGELLGWLFATAPEPPPAMEKLLGMAAKLGDGKLPEQAFQAILKDAPKTPEVWRMKAIGAMLDQYRAGQPRGKPKTSEPEAVRERLDAFLGAARGLALTGEGEPRIVAIGLLGRISRGRMEEIQDLAGLLDPKLPADVQSAALAALGRMSWKPSACEAMLANWSSRTPSQRSQILDVLVASDDSARVLLTALDKGQVPLTDIDVRRRQTLAAYKNEDLRALIAKLFTDKVDPNRVKVIEQYAAELAKLKGDVVRGKEVFGKKCGQCHKLDGAGHDVGPNLASLTDRSPQAMLVALLDPNRAVEAKFVEYVAVTSDGKLHRGMLAVETSTSLTLVGPEAKQETILRSDLEELKSSGVSLMPVGMEKELPPQDAADVLAYLGGFRPPHKAFPGNEPHQVEVRDDGSIRLPANAARIYGPQIVYEQQYGNLGYWSSPEDHAAWDFSAPAVGEYKVSLDFACAADAAGNTLVLNVGGQKLTFKVPSTGSWDQYKGQEIGSVKLPKGNTELTVASDGAIKGALIDLRSVKLVPVK